MASLPFRVFLEQGFAKYGYAAWLRLPNVFWLNSSDVALQGAAIAGALLAAASSAGVGQATADLDPAVCAVLVPVPRRAGIHQFSVGLPLAGKRLPGDLSRRWADSAGRISLPLAAVSAALSVWILQAGERRSVVEQLHHAELLLRNPAAAACRLVVRAPATGLAAEDGRRFHLLRRTDRAVLHFSAASIPGFCGRHHDPDTTADSRHQQSQLHQPADDPAMPVSAG